MKIINRPLLTFFATLPRCEWCRQRPADHAHHLFGKGFGGWSRFDVRINLMGLCHVCHSRFHDGHIERADLLAIVAKREGVLQSDIEAEIYRLRRL